MKYTALITALAAAMPCMMANSPYISKVIEFCPAPGQFIHSIPELTDEMAPEQVLAEVERQICGNEQEGARPGIISLGAFGGYVVFAFDHPVVNVGDGPDFKIYGNAFAGSNNSQGGSSEPGIIMVMEDTNGNGLPDDEWCEIAGAAHTDPGVMQNFEITYFRPENADAADGTVRWETNDPTMPSGTIEKSTLHTQSYWPGWYAGEQLTFSGTRLAPNATSDDGSFWVFKSLGYGYADNLPNNIEEGINLNWARRADGSPAGLKQADFIKVYTAMNQYCGWLGETSTEITGGEDLHPDAIPASISVATTTDAMEGDEEIFNVNGSRMSSRDHLLPGLYISCRGGKSSKILIR